MKTMKSIGRQVPVTAPVPHRGAGRGPLSGAVLLAGSAAFLSANPAAADEKMMVGVQGYMEQWVGVHDNDQAFLNANAMPISGIDIQSDSEIHFFGKKVLDNGIEVVVLVELEGNTDAAQIDGSYVEFTFPTLGLVQFGGAEHAAYQVHNASPDVGIGNQDGDYMNWIITPGAFTDGAATSFYPGPGVEQKIAYFSPSFAGFSINASFAPDTLDTTNALNADYNNSWTAALAYSGEFNGIGISADIGYGHLNKSLAINSQTVFQGGLNITFGGFTVGGSVARFDESLEGNDAGTFMTGLVYDAGVSYSTGPYAISVTWLRSDMEGDNTNPGSDTKNSVMLSGAYTLGAGVTAIASAFYVDYDDETALAANNNDGPAFVAGLAIEF